MASDAVIKAINESPLNRGLSGEDWVSNPANIAFERGKDIILFDAEGAEIYQIHILLQSRGAKAVRVIRAAFNFIFADHKADTIFGMVPVIRPDVKKMAERVGMKFAGKRQTEFGECELYVLSREMWKGDDQ